MKSTTCKLLLSAAIPFALLSGTAQASLTGFDSYFGNFAVSTDGWGGTSGVGDIRAEVSGGGSVVAAYLYTSNVSGNARAPSSLTFDGSSVTSFTDLGTNDTGLTAFRSDVTSIVQAATSSGGGIYNFEINEGGDRFNIDGHALVVVYEDPALPEASVGILDGFSDAAGDNTAINFGDPLDVSSAGFFAEMALGIGFSCCSQASNVSVNGTEITANAGGNDDGDSVANGSLITVGSFDDPFSPMNPTYTEDTERYDLAASGLLTDGDTSISIDTLNPSRDDNIFLATFYVSGRAGFNQPPPPPPPVNPNPNPNPNPSPVPLPASVFLLLAGLGGLGAARRFKKT